MRKALRMFRSARAMILTLILLIAGDFAMAGGLCGNGTSCVTGPAAPSFGGAFPSSPEPEAGGTADLARLSYERAATGLWRASTNGTCLGTLGAWHLTPYRIIAEGTLFEILSVSGSPALIEIVARRSFDGAPAEFTIAPLGSGRIDVIGGVLQGEPKFHDALLKCRRRAW